VSLPKIIVKPLKKNEIFHEIMGFICCKGEQNMIISLIGAMRKIDSSEQNVN